MGLAASHTLHCPSTDPEDNCIDAKQNRCQRQNNTRGKKHTNGFYFFFLGGLKMLQARDQTVVVALVWLFCALNNGSSI